MQKPYIGITDFTNFADVKKMIDVFERNKPAGSHRVLHAGVMMNFETFRDIDNEWSKVFPKKEMIADIFGLTSKPVYYCLHYLDYTRSTTFVDLIMALEYAGPFVNAIQLDMLWPDPNLIESSVHASRKPLEVILQVGSNAMEVAGNDPQEVVKRLADYDGMIHRVLLDKSMGRGLGLDAENLLPYVRAIKERYPNLGLVVAGGLGPESLHLLEPFLVEFPDVSIDAQSKLRPSGSALQPIDWAMASAYLVRGLEMLK
jgi:hypothetical protein